MRTEEESMREWFASLAACAVLSEIADALAPPVWKEHIRRIAALAALIVLVLPVRGLMRDGAGFPDPGELFAGFDEGAGEDGADGEVGREAWAGTAALVFETAERLGLDPGRMTVRLSEEGGVLTGIRANIPGSPYALRAELEGELSEAFGVPVTVEGSERAEEEGGSG